MRETHDLRPLERTVKVRLPFLFCEGLSLTHGGSPWEEKSLSLRKEIVSRMMDALSSCEVMAAGSGNNLASS